MVSFNVKGSAPCRTGPPSSDFIQLLERPRSSSAPNSRHYVPGTSAVIPPPLTRSQSGNSIIQSTGGNNMTAADPRNSPVHQQQQSPVSTSPSKTSPPSGITLNTTVQIIQVTEIMVKQGPFYCFCVYSLLTNFIKSISLLISSEDYHVFYRVVKILEYFQVMDYPFISYICLINQMGYWKNTKEFVKQLHLKEKIKIFKLVASIFFSLDIILSMWQGSHIIPFEHC